MNIFRLVLCLAGLATFLLVRHFSLPAVEVPSSAPLPLEPVQSTRAPTSLPTAPLEANPATGSNALWRFLPSPDLAVGRYVVGDQLVVIKRSATGLVYQLTNRQGTVLANELSELKFRQRFPALYGQLRLTGADFRGSSDPLLRLRVRADGRLK